MPIHYLHTNGNEATDENMEYIIEIEENERTLEFTLDVNIWEDSLCECANIEFDIEWVEVTDKNGDTQATAEGKPFFYLVEERYKSKIESMLDEDDKLFEAWKKHIEEV